MTEAIKTQFQIRRWYIYEEEILANEIGKVTDGEPVRKIVIGACVKNPYATGEHSQSLDLIVKNSPDLGREFGRRLEIALRGDVVQSYGKACLVGISGEYEHGNAFLTTAFADPMRDAVGGGAAWIVSTGKRGVPGTSIDIPLAHKDALYVRSHYDTVTVTFADGPNPDEVLVLIAVATRGRLHARLGGLDQKDVVGKDGLR